MDELIHQFVSSIFNDPGKIGMVGLLMFIAIGLIWLLYRRDKEHKEDIKDMIEQAKKQNDDHKRELMAIIDKYQEGQISMIQAINEIKLLLITIGAKI